MEQNLQRLREEGGAGLFPENVVRVHMIASSGSPSEQDGRSPLPLSNGHVRDEEERHAAHHGTTTTTTITASSASLEQSDTAAQTRAHPKEVSAVVQKPKVIAMAARGVSRRSHGLFYGEGDAVLESLLVVNYRTAKAAQYYKNNKRKT